MTDETTLNLLTLTTEIVAAHLAHNHISTSDLPGLIASVHGALAGLEGGSDQPPAEAPAPAATTVRKSLANPNHIISMIDGKPYALLKRHLTTQGLTPGEYRERFSLPIDYPMTAPAYSEKRRVLAKSIGLGRKPRLQPDPEPEPQPVAEPVSATPKRRGRKPAATA